MNICIYFVCFVSLIGFGTMAETDNLTSSIFERNLRGEDNMNNKEKRELFGGDRQGLSMRELSSGIERSGFNLPTLSQLVVHNDIVYISGQVDVTASDVKGQTKNILGKIDTLLEEAGTDKTRLLTSNIWLKDIDKDFQAMNEVWVEWMDPDNKPVRVAVEANMVFPNLLVEIQVTAAKT